MTIFLRFYLLHYLVCYNVKHYAIVVTLTVRSLSSSSASLAEVSKFSSHACSTARTHLERLKTARRKTLKAANLADLLCAVVTHSLLSVKVCLGLAIFCAALVRKSWSTVSNSPGASCRISSSVAGLIPGERTPATPRSVLQISDRHLRRYPIRITRRGSSHQITLCFFKRNSFQLLTSSIRTSYRTFI